ncbi:MAG: DUF86 domain-containing protein [Chloroflexota bacterium]|nr:DUF86 domain-containing protein [Chloroflexota bacterium]
MLTENAMVNVDKILFKFEMLDGFLDVVRNLTSLDRERYLADPVLIGSMRYYLQVSIECCLDVASHIIASERFRAPRDYADTFSVLEEENIIAPELSHNLRQMANFRNPLVKHTNKNYNIDNFAIIT